jgi:lipopolysaccharide export system protein LptC
MVLNRNTLISFLVVIAILSAFLILLNHEKKTTSSIYEPSYSDGFMKVVSAVQFNKDGVLSSRLTTPLMTHFPYRNTTKMISPHFTIYTKSKAPWQVTSNYGRASYGITSVYLWDHVKLYKETGRQAGTEIMTEAMMLYPYKQTAHTDYPVTLRQPGTKITSKGLSANLKTGTVNLLSKARGEYNPNEKIK